MNAKAGLRSILLLGALMTATWVSAASPLPMVSYVVQGKTVELVRFPAQKLLIDRACWARQNACLALRRIPEASLAAVRGQLAGGKNPGAVVCVKLGGHVVVGLDDRKNENSFCRFEDGSLISSGSLHAHARENDQRAGR